ncbi:MAG: uroporphyrinogen-III synthase, partial [Balneolaceae bacterium]|nr:uroporphyrinogen-III synthase [Balneolaceae bacterium]
MPQMHRILITRELTDEQLQIAEDAGLDVEELPAISITYRDNWLSVQDTVRKAGKIVLAFTSANGVKGFERFRKAGLDLKDNTGVYAVGGKTAEALMESGWDEADIRIPDRQDGVGLAQMLANDFLKGNVPADSTVLHFCGNRRRDEFRQYLADVHIVVKDIVVYKTELNEMNLPEDLNEFKGILFYSPSAVQAFRNGGGFTRNGLPELFAIGPTTAQELSIESGKHVHISPEPNTEVFLKFVARVLEEQEQAMECPPLKGGMGDDKNLYYNKSLKDLARELRNNSTKAEIRLWTEILRSNKSGHT